MDKIRMSRRAAAGVVALGLGLAAASVQSQAAVQLRAGLWEHSVRMSSQSGRLEAAMKEAQAAMAAMSPEERRMMEQMMGRQGAQFDVSGGQQRVRVCMTPRSMIFPAAASLMAVSRGVSLSATSLSNSGSRARAMAFCSFLIFL